MDEGLFFDIEPDFVVAGTGEDVITIILVFYLVRAIFRQLQQKIFYIGKEVDVVIVIFSNVSK